MTRPPAEDRKPTFTVVTPTFDRAHTLPRVFESLEQQTLKSFEWLVIDDGSSDGTRELVQGWMESSPFPIRYAYQANSGKAVCENRAAELARGAFLAVLDSDDWYAPSALETFTRAWRQSRMRSGTGTPGSLLCAWIRTARSSGIAFPPISSTRISRSSGRSTVCAGTRRAACGSRSLRPFRIPSSRASGVGIRGYRPSKVARKFRCRCINEVVLTKEYQPDGLSAGGGRLWVESPRAAKLSMLESLLDSDLGPSFEVLNYAHHFRFSLHGRAVSQGFSDSPSKLLWLVTAPAGAALYVRIGSVCVGLELYEHGCYAVPRRRWARARSPAST